MPRDRKFHLFYECLRGFARAQRNRYVRERVSVCQGVSVLARARVRVCACARVRVSAGAGHLAVVEEGIPYRQVFCDFKLAATSHNNWQRHTVSEAQVAHAGRSTPGAAAHEAQRRVQAEHRGHA